VRPPAALLLLPLLAACASRPAVVTRPPTRVPDFVSKPYEPLSRAAVVAIAQREWRLFGSPVDDDKPGTRPEPAPQDKPERRDGFWQRIGEYWWLGLNPDALETSWTGKHDEFGVAFPAADDGDFAWSAAFISYVFRIAGAGSAFPYDRAHHVYIDAARTGATKLLAAEKLDAYAPQQGDLICASRGAKSVRYDMLPAGPFTAHCDIVVATTPGQISVIGGNVDDAVTLKHVPVTPDGKLARADGTVLDTRFRWFVVVRVNYAPPMAATL
jgi:hypothetical protein